MSQYVFKVRVKKFGLFLPKGYEFQIVHGQRSLDNAAVNNAARAEYEKLKGKNPGAAMYLGDVEIISKP